MMIILILFGDNLADSYTIRGLIGLDKEISKISLRHRLQIEAWKIIAISIQFQLENAERWM